MKANQPSRQSGAVMWPVLTLVIGIVTLALGVWVLMVIQPIKQQQPQLDKVAVTAALKNTGDVSFVSPRSDSTNERFPSVAVSKDSQDQKQNDDYNVSIHHLSRSISSDQYAREVAEDILNDTKHTFSPAALKAETDRLVETFKSFGQTIQAKEVADIDKSVHSLGTVKATTKDGKSVEFSCSAITYSLMRDGQQADNVFIQNLQNQIIICAYADSGYALQVSLARGTMVANVNGTIADRTPQNTTPKANSEFKTALKALEENLIAKLPFTFAEKELKV